MSHRRVLNSGSGGHLAMGFRAAWAFVFNSFVSWFQITSMYFTYGAELPAFEGNLIELLT